VGGVPPRLEIEGLCKRFGDRTVVGEVGLTVEAGRVACLLGPSGCGKTTTLRLVAGVDVPDAGRIRVDGATVAEGRSALPPEARGVGLMFQDFALFPHLTVAGNVGFGLRGAPGAAARVAAMLARVGMSRCAGLYPHQLSGGEQQRVALARALAPRPGVMLMDEPFSGLDQRLRDEVRDETLELLRAEGAAVVLVTHEPAEAMRMADEILLMRDGRIVQRGTPYAIYTKPVDLRAARFFSDLNVIRGRVRGALTSTPFGPFLVPGVPDGSWVDIAIRPQHLRIDFDRAGKGPASTESHGEAARGIVERARFLGGESLVEFRMEHDGSILRAAVPYVFVPGRGTPLWLMFRRDRCFVFPAGDGSQSEAA
jgi:iron(III) transport system ATP-binding protein